MSLNCKLPAFKNFINFSSLLKAIFSYNPPIKFKGKILQRYPTKQIKIRDVSIGGDAPISVQSMTFSKTKDVKGTLEQIQRLYFAGCDIVLKT